MNGADAPVRAAAGGLDNVLITPELARRPSRPPDHAAENRALAALAEEMAASPGAVLQRLTDLVVELGWAQSAGVSVLEPHDPSTFRWQAVSGLWAEHVGGTMPFDASPCGVVVARNSPLLFARPHERFPAADVEPLIREILLVPFHAAGRPAGTLWATAHDEEGRFDAEDLRVLTNLARFASAAHRMAGALAEAERGREELERRVGERTTELTRANERLRASEAKHRALFEAVDEGFCVVEVLFDGAGRPRDYRFLEVNPAFERHTGLRGAAGRTMLELAPGIEAHWFETYGRVALTGEPVRFENGAEALGGRWFDVYAFRIGGPDRRRVAVLFTDITARRRAEAALRESEERFRALVTATSYAVYRMGPDWEEMRRLDGRGFLADTEAPSRDWLAEYIHPDDQPQVSAAIREAIRTKGVFELEHRVRRADGTLGWTHSRAVPLLDAGGAVREWFGAASDVTERRRAEEAVRESGLRFRTLVEGVPLLVWRAADAGAWSWASGQWTAYTGQPEPESHGRGWLRPVHPDDREAVEAAWREAGTTGVFRADHRLHHAGDARHRWVQSQATPVRDDAGRVSEWLGTTTDVEELRRRHEQRILIEELHHRGRNLLAVVGGIAEQTLATCGSLEEFGARFDRRLGALGRVQNLLSREVAPSVTVGELVRMELAAHGIDGEEAPDRVRLRGPEVVLPARAVQLLALALHELLTNAAKHGALRAPGGRLDIVWKERRGADGARRLRLDWAESGAALDVEAAGARRGFGRDLIEFNLPYELDAETRLEFGPGGLRCSIEAPLDGAAAGSGAPPSA